MSNVKNYIEQGGEKIVIGGILEIAEGGQVKGLPAAEFQADSSATTVAGVVADFNSMLEKLKAAGLMQSE